MDTLFFYFFFFLYQQYLYIGGISIQDANVWEQYQAISYHVLLLMFGENIDPQTPLESVCAFFIVMTGLVATALVVANMTYYVKMILQDSEAVSVVVCGF